MAAKPPQRPPRPPVNVFDIPAFLQGVAAQAREYLQDAGQACVLPGCGAVTLGVRCDKCLRILCPRHTFYQLHMTQTPTAYCPYCVLLQCQELFEEDDDAPSLNDFERNERARGNTTNDPNEPIDADFIPADQTRRK